MVLYWTCLSYILRLAEKRSVMVSRVNGKAIAKAYTIFSMLLKKSIGQKKLTTKVKILNLNFYTWQKTFQKGS